MVRGGTRLGVSHLLLWHRLSSLCCFLKHRLESLCHKTKTYKSSAVTRPPSNRNSIAPSNSASARLWVTWSTVVSPRSRTSRNSITRRSWVASSTALSGSSRSRTGGRNASPAQRDALRLAAAQPDRPAGEQCGQTELLCEFGHPCVDVLSRSPAHAQSECEVLVNGHGREQNAVLRDVPDVPRRRRQRGHVLPGEDDPPRGRAAQPDDGFQHRRLPAAGRSHQHRVCAGRHGERHPVEGECA